MPLSPRQIGSSPFPKARKIYWKYTARKFLIACESPEMELMTILMPAVRHGKDVGATIVRWFYIPADLSIEKALWNCWRQFLKCSKKLQLRSSYWLAVMAAARKSNAIGCLKHFCPIAI